MESEQGQTNAAVRWRRRKDTYRVTRSQALTEVDDDKFLNVEFGGQDIALGLPAAIAMVGCRVEVAVTLNPAGRALRLVADVPAQIIATGHPALAPGVRTVVGANVALAPAAVGTTLWVFSTGRRWIVEVANADATLAQAAMGDLDMNQHRLTNVGAPLADDDAATAAFLVARTLDLVQLGGDANMIGDLDMNGNHLSVPAPTDGAHAANKAYVDGRWDRPDQTFTRVEILERLDMNDNRVRGVADPVDDTDAANKRSVLAALAAQPATFADLTVTGDLDVAGVVVEVATPTDINHAANKAYVDAAVNVARAQMQRVKVQQQTLADGITTVVTWPDALFVGGAPNITYDDGTATFTLPPGQFLVTWTISRSSTGGSIATWGELGSLGSVRRFGLTRLVLDKQSVFAIVAAETEDTFRVFCLNLGGQTQIPTDELISEAMTFSIARIL